MINIGSAVTETISFITEKILIIVAIIFAVLAIRFKTPEEQRDLFYFFFPASPQTSFDMPSIFTWFFILLILIAIIDCIFINQKAYHSDFVWVNGLDFNCSCIGSQLKKDGEWCWMRTEGIKSYPIEGSYIIAGLATHTYQIGNMTVIEGGAIPNTPLTHVPSDIKLPVRQRRKGIFGATECAIAYLSPRELAQNKQFKTDDYKDLLEPGESGKTFDTAAFIDSVRDKNRDLNMIIEFNNGEHDSLTQYLENMVQVGRAVMRFKDDNPIDRLIRKG